MNSEDYSFSTKTGAVFKEPNAEGGFTVKGDSLEGYYSVYHGRNTPPIKISKTKGNPPVEISKTCVIDTEDWGVVEVVGNSEGKVVLDSSVTPLEITPSDSVEEKVEITIPQEENVSEGVSEATTEGETKPKKKSTKATTHKEE